MYHKFLLPYQKFEVTVPRKFLDSEQELEALFSVANEYFLHYKNRQHMSEIDFTRIYRMFKYIIIYSFCKSLDLSRNLDMLCVTWCLYNFIIIVVCCYITFNV